MATTSAEQASFHRQQAMMATAIELMLKRQQRRRAEKAKRQERRYWDRPWLQRRQLLGEYDTLMLELAEEDVPGYIHQRMCHECFMELLEMVAPHISKQTTNIMRAPVPPGVCLALTLRYLATGK